jgi:hypothetical protein
MLGSRKNSKPRVREKLAVGAAESHTACPELVEGSGARCVGQPFGCYCVSVISFNSRIIFMAFWLFGSNLSDFS